MKLWKRNAVVVAIVLFVCAAVYLNWSYQKEGDTEAGKTLGQAALVGGTADTAGRTLRSIPRAFRQPGCQPGSLCRTGRLLCFRTSQPPTGQGCGAVPAAAGRR